MSQVHRPHRETGPGLGRVLVSTVVSLGALVALGVAIYAWNSPEAPNERVTPAATAASQTTVSPIPSGPTGPAASAVGPVASAPSPAQAPADLDVSGVAESDPLEDLRDIERPVSYSDAEAFFRARDYEEASRYFSAYVEDHGDNPWGLYMLGLSRLKAGHPEAAESAFLGALDLDPDHTKSLVNLARARMEFGSHAEALIPIERAIQISPDDSGAHRVYARALHNLGRSEDAARVYVSALEIDDGDAWSMNNLGLIRIEQEEFAAAVPPLARATQIDSTVAVFQNNLGIALERLGDFSGAVAAYDRALDLDGSYGRAQENRSRAESLSPTQSLETLDLAVFAAAFAEEIAGSRAAVESNPSAPVAGMEDSQSVDVPDASSSMNAPSESPGQSPELTADADRE